MKLSYYLFEHSYLMGVEYNPLLGTLKLIVDAKLTFEHPSVNATDNEAKFEDVELLFEGVQYLKVISDSLLVDNPNEDLGSIERLIVSKTFENCRDIDVQRANEKYMLSTELSDNETVSVTTKSYDFALITFISEMISFELGCEKVSINEICE